MRPTTLGWKAIGFYVVLVGAFFATPYANLYFLLLSFLTVLGPCAVFWAWRSLRGVTIAWDDAPPAMAGTDAIVRVRLETGAPIPPGLAIRVAATSPRGEAIVATTALEALSPDRAGRSIEVPLPVTERGVYRVDRVAVESTFPVGLVRHRKFATLAAPTLHVYPRPFVESGVDLHAALAKELGLPQTHGAGSAVELRDYADGDDVRRIHWRKSAGRTNWVVREPTDEFDPGHEIVLDRRCNSASLEHALSILSGITRAAQSGKEPVRLRTQDHDRVHGEGQCSYRELFEFLARCEPLPLDAVAPPAAGPEVPRLPTRPQRAEPVPC